MRFDVVALSVLSSPLGDIRNLSAKLMLLLHHMNDGDSNKKLYCSSATLSHPR